MLPSRLSSHAIASSERAVRALTVPCSSRGLLLVFVVLGCGGAPFSAPASPRSGAEPTPAAEPTPVAIIADYCGDGRVSDGEVCDPNVRWEARCPDGWGMCWTCESHCGSWSMIYANDIPAVVDNHSVPGSTMRGRGMGSPPPACEERHGDNVTGHVYDERGRVVSFSWIGVNGSFTWNERGQVLTSRRGNQSRQWTYTPSGQPLQSVVLDHQGSEPRRTALLEWTYDAAGRLLEESVVLFPSGIVTKRITHTYDARGNPLTEVWEGSQSFSQSFGYDAEGELAQWDGAALAYSRGVLSRVSARGSEEWRLREDGRVDSYRVTSADHGRSIEYERDARGRTVAQHGIEGELATTSRYEWGPFGLLRELEGPELVAEWSYDASGRETSWQDRGFQERYEYDDAGRLVKRTLTTITDPPRIDSEQEFRWSDRGQLLGSDLRLPGAYHSSFSSVLRYDGDRLVSATMSEAPPFLDRVDYDYRCLSAVFDQMPRREFTERESNSEHTRREILQVSPWNDASAHGMHWRNRTDPSDWPFGF